MRATPRPRPSATSSARSAVSTLTALAFLAATVAGCASGGWLGGASGGSKSNSGESSKGSGGSGDSSDKSGDSSQKSGDSSDKSGNSSKDGGSSHSKSESRSSDDGQGASAAISWTLLGVAVVAAVIWLVFYATTDREEAQARAYLQSHRRAIRVSLARGSGPFYQHVAMALSLPSSELPVLAGAIHARRDALDRWLVPPNLGPEDTRGFSADLLDALIAEPRLGAHVASARERLEAALGAVSP